MRDCCKWGLPSGAKGLENRSDLGGGWLRESAACTTVNERLPNGSVACRWTAEAAVAAECGCPVRGLAVRRICVTCRADCPPFSIYLHLIILSDKRLVPVIQECLRE
ncbi:hypothetical protein GCM10010507_19790 [Streptomyces cinnamoneus]|uniref:Uncharacterized protein n=1 Tax=Streptomyces cinnamoneus TaxID=53446 RepID=A0A918WG90_STRCJ|nr:hypothetical protein GCM10010507_19790 [Streptomyces cinnamoneus]